MRKMKKRLLALCLIVFSGGFCFAQNFLVYTAKGEIIVRNGDKSDKVVPGMVLQAKSVLTIPSEARLVILYEKNKELYTIKSPTTDQLGNLIKKESCTIQQLTESYLAFIKQKITDSGNPKDKNFKQTAGTSYRETDSLLLNVLVPEIPVDTTHKNHNE